MFATTQELTSKLKPCTIQLQSFAGTKGVTRTMESGDHKALISRARRHGIRMTRQRKAILRVLCELDGHATAEEIHRRTIQYHEHVDLSTAYRTLDRLRDLRIVTRTDMGQGRALYEVLANNSHHHLVCECCGEVRDLDEVYLVPVAWVIQQDLHFRPLLEHMAIFGLCEQCDEEEHGSSHAR